MAKVRKRGKSYVLDCRLNGKRERLPFDSKDEAEEMCEKYNHLRRAKRLQDFEKLLASRNAIIEAEAQLSGVTLKDSMFQYAKICSKRKSAQTEKNEKGDFKALFNFLSVEKDVHYLKEVTPPMLLEYQGRLTESVSKATCNRRFAGIKNFFSVCVEWGYLEKSPAKLVKTFKVKSTPRKTFTDEEINLIAKRLAPYQRRPFLIGAIHGCRPGEALASRVFDYDPVSMTLTVYSGKNAEVARAIYLLPASVEIIESALSERENLRRDSFIFINSKGRPLKAAVITKAVRKIRRKLGIEEGKVPYSLRHTFATKCARQNIASEKTRKLMGHATIRTTENYYKLEDKDLRDTMTEVAKVFDFETREEIKTVTNSHKIG